MAFKSIDDVLRPDPRFETLVTIENGIMRRATLDDHHRSVANIAVSTSAPAEVSEAFDRARNTYLYAYFSYELLVVSETQAFGSFELALKYRLRGHEGPARGTLRNLIDQARKARLLPALPRANGPVAKPFDRFEALIELRNALSHGTSHVHTPAMAQDVLEACAEAINLLYAHSDVTDAR